MAPEELPFGVRRLDAAFGFLFFVFRHPQWQKRKRETKAESSLRTPKVGGTCL